MAHCIEFSFDIKKTVQVAAIFLKLNNNKMHYLGLLKLLYMADRLALKKIDQSLTGDHYVSMKYGPVLSKVYDLIKGSSYVQDDGIVKVWKEYISTKVIDRNYKVKLLKDPGVDELSEEEEEIIKEISSRYSAIDRFDLAEITHQFPEWENPLEQDPPTKVIPIKVEDILLKVGKTEEEIRRIQETVEREAYLDKILNT